MAGDDRIFEGDSWWKRFQMAFNARQGVDFYEMMRRISRRFVWPRRRWPTQVDAVYVSGIGVDDYAASGRGITADMPYATIEAALREARPGALLTINLAAGYEYELTEVDVAERVQVAFVGTAPDADADGVFTGTTTEVQAAAPNAEGIYSVPADGVAADEWRGAVVSWADGVSGVVYQNDATSGGAVQFKATQDRDAAPLSREGVEATVYTPGSLASIRFASDGNPTIAGASKLQFELLRLRPPEGSPGVALLVSDAATARFTRCLWLDEWQRVSVFDFGSIQFRNCFFACSAADSKFGFVTIAGLGRCTYRQGCAWDGSTATTPAGRLPFQAITNGAGGGGHNLSGSHVWREMVAANHDQEVVRFLEQYTVNRRIFLLDCEGPGFTVNQYRDHGRGVFCEYPDLHGSTTDSYAVKARQARVRLGRGSSLTTAVGTNTVCCVDRDGAEYRVARDDRNATFIEGGSPEPQYPGSVNVEAIGADKVLTWADAEYQRLDPGASARNVDLPGTDSGGAGLEYLPLGAGSFRVYNNGTGNLTVRWSNNGTPTTVAVLAAGQTARFLVTDGAKESRAWTHSGVVS